MEQDKTPEKEYNENKDEVRFNKNKLLIN